MRYIERISIEAVDVDDARLVDAFVRIDRARGDISLSYFEFGTLAAFMILAQADLDVAVLEIGLGGRLDAVNLIDADAAILTSVDLDHQEYLGATREQIGWEKAHIFRRGRPAVIAEPDPPASVIALAAAIGKQVSICCRNRCHCRRHPPLALSFARWQHRWTLPIPGLSAPCQRRNAVAAVCAWWSVRHRLAYSVQAQRGVGIETATVPGRLQRLPACRRNLG